MFMKNSDAWQIFKNTGSVEAYITFAQTKDMVTSSDADNSQDKGNNSEDK